MIKWETEVITEPPLLRKYTDEQLRSFAKGFGREPLVLKVPSISLHVERCIQLMASHASSSLNTGAQDGLCKAAILERKCRPNLDKKSV